jgi:hypothetical protein
MSADEDLYLNQSEADALFFPDALFNNADELDFEPFGDASGLDDGTFNGITGSGLTSSIFEVNGDLEEVKVANSVSEQVVSEGAPSYSNDFTVFNKPTLELESMGMAAYGISGLYSPLSPSEKLSGLTLAQMTTPSYGLQQAPYSATTTMPFVTSSSSSTVAATNGMTRFGSQEFLSRSTSPNALSPNSSDGQDYVVETEMKMAQEPKQYRSVDFVDQVDGDGDGLQPLPQMTRPSMQRSFSCHALGQLRPPPSSSATENSRPPAAGLSSPNGARLPQQPNLAEIQSLGMRPMMRRVYSAGDIQTLNGMQQGGSLSGSASPSFEDGNYRVGKYSMEERKLRITRYQQKRTQRNFNKKIKYACRKTLADSRPRVRGRFAKNIDDDIPTSVRGRSKREDDDDEEGDGHMYHVENSSGEYSDMVSAIKVEHRSVNSM